MSSKKGWPMEQVDDTDGGVAVATRPDCTPYSNEEFVKMWLGCDSYRVMSANTGMTVSAVQARATRLRKAGVQLPSFTRATRKTKAIDVTGLNNMIETNYETMTKGEPTNE